jgi:hypothetical protein
VITAVTTVVYVAEKTYLNLCDMYVMITSVRMQYCCRMILSVGLRCRSLACSVEPSGASMCRLLRSGAASALIEFLIRHLNYSSHAILRCLAGISCGHVVCGTQLSQHVDSDARCCRYAGAGGHVRLPSQNCCKKTVRIEDLDARRRMYMRQRPDAATYLPGYSSWLECAGFTVRFPADNFSAL